MGADLRALLDVRAGLVLAVQALLRYEAAEAARLPDYFPLHLRKVSTGKAGFDTLRQSVRVTDRSALDAFRRARRWEREPEDQGPDKYAPPRSIPDEAAAPNAIPWDEHAIDHFRRAVILGDPGGGKTWLLRFVTRHLAAAAARAIEDRAPLGRVVVPLHVRLAAIADALTAPGATVADVLVDTAHRRATRQLETEARSPRGNSDEATRARADRLTKPPSSFGPWVRHDRDRTLRRDARRVGRGGRVACDARAPAHGVRHRVLVRARALDLARRRLQPVAASVRDRR